MKKFDKFILWLFSLIIMVIIVFITLLVFNLFGAREIWAKIPEIFYTFIVSDRDAVIASTIILIVFFLLALKGFLFQSKTKKDKIDGILLENNNGKLLISKETLENLVRDISKRIKGTESISSKIHLDENNEIVVNINAVVYQDAVIKEVTKKMQEDIKSAIKQASDLEVSEVNVIIEKISNKVSPEMIKKEQKEEEFIKKEKIVAEDKTKDIEKNIEEETKQKTKSKANSKAKSKAKTKDKDKDKGKTKEVVEEKTVSKVETKEAKVKK